MHELAAAIDAAADPVAAAALARYFQVRPGGYGEGDRFAGVKLSRIRVLARAYRHRTFATVDWLDTLHSPVHEHRLGCLVVMAERARRLVRDPAGDGEHGEIHRCYLANTAYVNNWDLVDVSCGPVVGGYLTHRQRDVLDSLAGSPSLWERRIAIVSTGWFIGTGDASDTWRIATRLLDDPHDLIHKATGWMLREAGRKVSRDQLRGFLDANADRMPRTMLRYALEHFAPDERRHYLGLRGRRTPSGGSAATPGAG